MATDGALGRRRAHAIERIVKYAEGQASEHKLDIPMRDRHGPDLLFVRQLEWLADYLEGVPLPSAEQSGLDALSARELPTLEAAKALMSNPPSEAIEDDVETEDSGGDYGDMTNSELETLIKERGLDKGKAHNKAGLIAVLETADKETE